MRKVIAAIGLVGLTPFLACTKGRVETQPKTDKGIVSSEAVTHDVGLLYSSERPGEDRPRDGRSLFDFLVQPDVDGVPTKKIYLFTELQKRIAEVTLPALPTESP